MSLKLASSNRNFDDMLRRIDADGSTSPLELQQLRDAADKHVFDATGLDVANAEMALGTSVVRFLFQADDLVETMQRVALEARKDKVSAERREDLKAAIEHQLAYIVAGYQSSIQRL